MSERDITRHTEKQLNKTLAGSAPGSLRHEEARIEKERRKDAKSFQQFDKLNEQLLFLDIKFRKLISGLDRLVSAVENLAEKWWVKLIWLFFVAILVGVFIEVLSALIKKKIGL